MAVAVNNAAFKPLRGDRVREAVAAHRKSATDHRRSHADFPGRELLTRANAVLAGAIEAGRQLRYRPRTIEITRHTSWTSCLRYSLIRLCCPRPLRDQPSSRDGAAKCERE